MWHKRLPHTRSDGQHILREDYIHGTHTRHTVYVVCASTSRLPFFTRFECPIRTYYIVSHNKCAAASRNRARPGMLERLTSSALWTAPTTRGLHTRHTYMAYIHGIHTRHTYYVVRASASHSLRVPYGQHLLQEDFIHGIHTRHTYTAYIHGIHTRHTYTAYIHGTCLPRTHFECPMASTLLVRGSSSISAI